MREKQIQKLSTPQPDCRTVEVCDICGITGIQDDLLICPNCKICREHVYCRKIFIKNRTADWYCDECEGTRMGSSKGFDGDAHKAQASNPSGCIYDQPGHSSFAGRYRGKEKMVTKGKVKCCSKRDDTPLKRIKHVDSSSSSAERPKTPIHRKGLPLKSSMTSVPFPCNRPAKSVIQRQGSHISHVPKETKAVQAIRKELVQMAKTAATMDPAEIQDANLVEETCIPSEGPSAPAPDKLLQLISSGHEVSDLVSRISDFEELKPTETERNAENYSRAPSHFLSWKGRFEIRGDNFHYISPGHVAVPRARLLRKVLECSIRMPELLQFKLISRKESWRDLFQDDCPGEDDIGLYFYSGENTRSFDYDFLQKFIVAQDFAMKCDLGEVELYLFASKLLPAGYQKLYNEYYFWGVFRKIAKHNDVSGAQRGPPPTS